MEKFPFPFVNSDLAKQSQPAASHGHWENKDWQLTSSDTMEHWCISDIWLILFNKNSYLSKVSLYSE